MANTRSLSIKAVPRKKGKWNFSFTRFGRRKQLIVSVLAVYFIVGGLIGYSLWNTNGEDAKASENASVSASIRLNEEKDFSVGDTISLNVTIQNTSVVESINSIALDLFSTNSSVTWSTINGGNIRSLDLNADKQVNSFKLPVLSSGERVEYIATGKIDKADTEYLTILGKIRFLNKSGLQESSTNRVFTKLINSGAKIGRSLELKLESNKISSGAGAAFNLRWPEGTVNPRTLTGKVYLSDRNSTNVIASSDCQVSDSVCTGEFNNLTTGNYSLLFVDSNEEVYSNIVSLDVAGSFAEFVPNALSSFNLPFGSISINGLTPVMARKVLSLNNNLKETDECVFEVKSGNNVVSSIKAKVNNNRTCYTDILTSQIPTGEGVYKVTLKGTSLEQTVSFLNKPTTLINLENKTVVQTKGQPILLQSSGLVDDASAPLNNVPVTLGVYSNTNFSYKEYNSIDGQALKVDNGTFSLTAPGDIFAEGGFYKVFIRLGNGQVSDFVNINFNDFETGVVTSGVNIEQPSSLKAGERMTFSVANIVDRSKVQVPDGDCEAIIYASSLTSQGLSVNGSLKQGVCKVNVEANQIVQSGPALITFPAYSQSRQFNVFPNRPATFGGLKLEYEPAQKNFANTLILGPIADNFGNLTNSFGLKVEAINGEDIVQTIGPVDVVEGFAKVVLPASLFTDEGLKVKVYDAENNLLMEQLFTTIESDKLILPSIPTELNGDSKLKLSLGVNDTEIESCIFVWIKSEAEKITETVAYDKENKTCSLDWNLNQYRNTKQALVKITAKDKVFYQVVNLTSGDPGNIFALGASIRLGQDQELDYNILTSPVQDKFGLPVKSGNIRFTYNGKVADVPVQDGFAKLQLSANKLDNNDLRSILGGKILELDIDAKASPVSISRTNTITSFLSQYDISNRPEEIRLLEGTTIVPANTLKTFSFKSNSCKIRQLSDRQDSTILLSHWQGGVCFVEVGGVAGNYTLQVLDGNFVLTEFKYLVNNSKDEVLWCVGESNCIIQVLASTLGQPEAVIIDGDRQYKFQSSSSDNSISLKEPSLNPLKKYSVRVNYTSMNNNQVTFYHEINGDRLVK